MPRKKNLPQPRKQRTAGLTYDKVDRTLLHQFLWKHRDRQNLTTFRPGELCEMLGIRNDSMSEIFREMCAAGMLRKMAHWKYEVIDPEKFVWESKLTLLPEK